MKWSFLLFFLRIIAFPGKGFAQEMDVDSVLNSIPFRNSVYGKLGGSGLFGSLNYERVFQVAENDRLALRVGGIYIPEGNYDGKNPYMFAELTVFFERKC